jgi:signal transduction histidine kinase
MRSILEETSANAEKLRTRADGQTRNSVANGSQLGAHPQPTDEKDQPSRQNAQERERLALLGTSAVVFAHEVGNPLHAIFGSLEFIETELKRRQIVDPVLTSMIGGALRETDRLRGLLSQFRSLAKTQYLDLRLVDLATVIEEFLALQRSGWRAAGIAVKLECQDSLPLVMLDTGKITQAILNLCKNAVEAMPDGGCLSIRVFRSGPMIVMEIADTGVGVPDALDPFQLFITTKPAGSGLGLAILQQIVMAHKGTISYKSPPGLGTTFTINLPVEPDLGP